MYRSDVCSKAGHLFRSARNLVLVAALLLLTPIGAEAQELNCSVRIDRSALSGGSEFQHLNELQSRIAQYLNDRSWTEDSFRQYERIKCNVEITFLGGTTQGFDNFQAQLTVGGHRPIYGTPQTTNVTQIADASFTFGYEPNQSLIFDPDRFDPLASVLDFYAYVLIGYDYDTFAPLGGTPYFNKARDIADLGQAANAGGWQVVSSERNRGVLIRELTDPRLERVRRAYFDYHYNCLDHFVSDSRAARQSAMGVLNTFKEVFEEQSNQYVTDLFFATKHQELVGVFENSEFSQEAYGILLSIDPSRSNIYDRLIR